MTKIFKTLYTKIFGEKTDPLTTISIAEENFISIVVDKFQRPIIRINLQNLDETSAKKFAESLFVLNKGGNEQQIMDMLLELADNDPSRKPFIMNVLQSWNSFLSYYNNYPSDDHPFVSPLNFSKLFLQQHTNEKQK